MLEGSAVEVARPAIGGELPVRLLRGGDIMPAGGGAVKIAGGRRRAGAESRAEAFGDMDMQQSCMLEQIESRKRASRSAISKA